MRYINRNYFIKAFQSMKKIKHLNSTEVAKRSQLSRTYVYHLASKKSKSKRITIKTVKKIAHGFGLNTAQTKAWLSTMRPTQSTENSYIHQRHQVTKQQSSHKSKNIPPTRSPRYHQPLLHAIRDVMSTKGINSGKLASRSGLREPQVNDYINGVKIIPKNLLTRLAKGLGINAYKLTKYLPDSNKNRSATSQQHPANNKQIHVDPIVFKIAERLSRLNHADLAIINMIINRLVNAEKNDNY